MLSGRSITSLRSRRSVLVRPVLLPSALTGALRGRWPTEGALVLVAAIMEAGLAGRAIDKLTNAAWAALALRAAASSSSSSSSREGRRLFLAAAFALFSRCSSSSSSHLLRLAGRGAVRRFNWGFCLRSSVAGSSNKSSSVFFALSPSSGNSSNSGRLSSSSWGGLGRFNSIFALTFSPGRWSPPVLLGAFSGAFSDFLTRESLRVMITGLLTLLSRLRSSDGGLDGLLGGLLGV